MDKDTFDFSDLAKNSLQTLQKFAKENLHIKSVTTYRKPELINIIQQSLQNESEKNVAAQSVPEAPSENTQSSDEAASYAKQDNDMDTAETHEGGYIEDAPRQHYERRTYGRYMGSSGNYTPGSKSYSYSGNNYSGDTRSYHNEQRGYQDDSRNYNSDAGYTSDSRQRRDDFAPLNQYNRYKPRINTDRPYTRDGSAPFTPANEKNTIKADGILEIMPDGFGFLRAQNCCTSEKDVYVSANFIRRVGLRTGDHITGLSQVIRTNEKFPSLFQIDIINGRRLDECRRRPHFDSLTPIYPDSRITLETENQDSDNELSTRIIDLISPIGKGQRGLIVSPPKAGKTTLLKQIANGITQNHPDIKLIILLIDERPEEVTDIQRSTNANVIFSTFDEEPEHHAKVAEMILEHGKRLVESGDDVVILLDSITRLARSYNLIVPASGRALSGGLDPTALFKPKKFFGAARNIENGGSLTIIATALIETGSKMDDVIFEEFKGTGNMEIHLNRKLSERRIFPAFDLNKSGTRRDDLLLSKAEFSAMQMMRRNLAEGKTDKVTELIITGLTKTKNNAQFVSIFNDALTESEKTNSFDDDIILNSSFS